MGKERTNEKKNWNSQRLPQDRVMKIKTSRERGTRFRHEVAKRHGTTAGYKAFLSPRFNFVGSKEEFLYDFGVGSHFCTGFTNPESVFLFKGFHFQLDENLFISKRSFFFGQHVLQRERVRLLHRVSVSTAMTKVAITIETSQC